MPWHRKFVNQFWSELDLPRTYAVLTEDIDRKMYASLEKTIIRDSTGNYVFQNDPNKLNSFTENDLTQIRLDIAEAMASLTFAMDLDFKGRNRIRNFGYNLSFSSQAEQFHDIIHGETGQGMRSTLTAGGDQCFFVHHTFVDLLFETWLNDVYKGDVPITKDHYENSDDLQKDYKDYEELENLFKKRYFTDEDYKYIRRITAPLSRQAVFFEEIKHIQGYRRVIMYHNGEEIGRFAVLTGQIETCLACARRQSHVGQFLIQRLVPITEIIWNIDNEWHMWDTAPRKFEEIGMSSPIVISF